MKRLELVGACGACGEFIAHRDWCEAWELVLLCPFALAAKHGPINEGRHVRAHPISDSKPD